MKITEYSLKTEKKIRAKLTVAADVHGFGFDAVLTAIAASKPDVILIPGDLTNRKNGVDCSPDFLSEAAKIAPTFYSIGNHERKCGVDKTAIGESGAVLLDDAYYELDGLVIGGLSSGFSASGQSSFKGTPPPDVSWLAEFCGRRGYRILMSHHPEYYPAYLKDLDCDLIVSGHAHGGQWRFFGQGVFAPGQGIFPKYTSGIYDGKLIVSRGLCNHTSVPRIFNPTELININVNI
ncbi:MAG: metallophosphoesterase [Clostridia bacterium]|nr:metallophosphoesterase [Clostridia bacterium]